MFAYRWVQASLLSAASKVWILALAGRPVGPAAAEAEDHLVRLRALFDRLRYPLPPRRMVLVMLRRELKAEEALTLWEIGWAREQLELAEGQEAAGVAAGSGASGSRGMARQRSGSSSGSGGALASLTAPAAGAEQSAGSGSGRASPAGGGLLRPGSASSFRGGAAPAPARGAGGGGGSSAAGTFQLCFIAAVVRAQRWKLMHQCRDSDDVLRLFNTIDIDFFATLDSAEKLQRRCELGRAVLERL